VTLKILSNDNNILVLEVHIPLGTVMLEGEQSIEQTLNEVGALASGELLKRFDTDGSAIQIGDLKLTSKGQIAKTYQTPYGETRVSRHVYQTARGGSTFCPMENDARIIQNATPKLAKTISHKYSKLSTDEVKADLSGNHGRQLSRSYIQNVSEMVGNLIQAKEEAWNYKTPLLEKPVATVSIGLDGTTIYLREDGYRETMVGTLALYDDEGNRFHTPYIGGAPEYGKSTFKTRMVYEIKHVKQLYPDALYIGIADGAADNWSFLEQYTSIQITDFWHATEYLAETAEALFPGKKQHSDRKEWLKQQCHGLKHTQGAALGILSGIKEKIEDNKYTTKRLETIQKTITYFSNQAIRMNYAAQIKQDLPIGSCVTEAACKMIVKQRLCQSGMKWYQKGASIILSLRTLERSNRWEEFWGKVSQYGVQCC
jgi:hypothetical protein